MVRCNHLYRLGYRIRPICKTTTTTILSSQDKCACLLAFRSGGRTSQQMGVCLMINVVRALYLRPNLSTWMAPLKHLMIIVILLTSPLQYLQSSSS